MEALAEKDHETQSTIPFKRFSRTDYPSHEKGGEHEEAIKVKCKGGEFAGYQHFYCSECNKILELEPLTISNIHVNNKPQRKYSVLQIGGQCPKCKKTDMIKITFATQSVLQPEKAKRICNKL